MQAHFPAPLSYRGRFVATTALAISVLRSFAEFWQSTQAMISLRDTALDRNGVPLAGGANARSRLFIAPGCDDLMNDSQSLPDFS
jgi:hypothetical protein